MKVALTNATTWPYVRRGMERFINEMAAYLAKGGHDVTIISSKPGRKEIIKGTGYKTVCYRRLWHPVFARIGLLEFHMFFFPCLFHLIRERFDVVLSVSFMDAYAAQIARRLTGAGCVFTPNGLPPKVSYIRSLSLKGAVFERAVRNSDCLVAMSEYMRQYFLKRWGQDSLIIPMPLDAEKFRPRPELKAKRPTIICAAALQDRRKGGRLLMRAFDRLKQTRPDAILQVASSLQDEMRQELLSLVAPRWRNDVRFLSATDELPELVAAATISVLPSIWEPFGMVVVESMAAGTPAVGARDGALPELIPSPDVGRLFDPGDDSGAEPTNLEGLARALDECIDLASDPQTVYRCRRHAMKYSWYAVGPQYESQLKQASGHGRSVNAVGVS
jgi:phosphatidylinositol alpha-mannosyltransferase